MVQTIRDNTKWGSILLVVLGNACLTSPYHGHGPTMPVSVRAPAVHQQRVFLLCSNGDDWCLTHLQGTVALLVYQEVTEPMRIVFLGALLQVVRPTALLSCQCRQGNGFCDQYQIVEFQAAHHGRGTLTTTGVGLVCQRVYGLEGCAQRARAPRAPAVVPHLLPQGAAYRFIPVRCVVSLRSTLRQHAEVLMGACRHGCRWRCRVGRHCGGGMFTSSLAEYITLWKG